MPRPLQLRVAPCPGNTKSFYDNDILSRVDRPAEFGMTLAAIPENGRFTRSFGDMSSEKLVQNIMRPLDQYHCISEEGTLEDALRLMSRNMEEGKPLCLVVLEGRSPKRGIIKGFVSETELVFGLAAHFLKGAHRSGPIFWEGQFEAECLQGVKKKVGEVMAPFEGWVREKEMIMEAVFLLNKFQTRILPVVDQEEVTGIIHLEDILREIPSQIAK